MRTHATKHGTNCVGKTIPKNCHILGNVLEILRFPSPILRFPTPKIQFSSPEIQFSSHGIRFTQIGFLLSSMAFCFLQRLSDFLQRLSAFSNGFPIFSNGFPIFLNGFPISEKSEKIYLWQEVYKLQKIAIQASYFFATRSPSFAVPAKQYLRLTQHTPVVHLCSQQCAISKI